jgi:hypothetical protein
MADVQLQRENRELRIKLQAALAKIAELTTPAQAEKFRHDITEVSEKHEGKRGDKTKGYV